ncbi:AAA domain-containing protein, partial [Anaerorhabdus sp.]|uniref:AAA domain-containing protein n=2 Tax=Anaerorhabdus sp. TaxID=1872524 RepID=UPI002FCBAE9E
NDVDTYRFDNNKVIVTFNNGQIYTYNCMNFNVFNKVEEIDLKSKLILHNNVELEKLEKVNIYVNDWGTYKIKVYFLDGKLKIFDRNSIKIVRNILASKKNMKYFDYFYEISKNTLMISEKDKKGDFYKKQYDSIRNVREDTLLAKYFMRKTTNLDSNKTVIYPFGNNLSQMEAVNNSMNSDISIIEGPPGTGKTFTILNIIANIMMMNKTALIVSYNNLATENIYDKMKERNLEFFLSKIGNNDNSQKFIEKGQVDVPNLEKYELDIETEIEYYKAIRECESLTKEILSIKNEIGKFYLQRDALEVESKHFGDYFDTTKYENLNLFRTNTRVSSSTIFRMLDKCEKFDRTSKDMTLWFKLKSYIYYGAIWNTIDKKSPSQICSSLQKEFYKIKLNEINLEIKRLDDRLKELQRSKKEIELIEKSMSLFMSHLYKKFGDYNNDKKFIKINKRNSADFFDRYPIVLSSTSSARLCCFERTYDYLIIDEASQVDLMTGVLALTCAHNLIIVGDLMQLGNIIKYDDIKKYTEISDKYGIPYEYRHENQCLLSSIVKVFPEAPRVMLKEHYRCHPKIINFCNEKFYNNQLIVMTEIDEKINGRQQVINDVLDVRITKKGNHARDKFNLRQINVIKNEILPSLLKVSSIEQIGIIAPYNEQVSKISDELVNSFEILTVHKFQGREKDNIIISTVDNRISKFTDNPNMLNVALSRARKRVKLIVSKDEEYRNTNIGDFIRYVRYNNCEVSESNIYSVFDLLYKCRENDKIEYLKGKKLVSKFDSENITYNLILEILHQFPELDVEFDVRLNRIFRKYNRLNEEEKRFVLNANTHVDFLFYRKIDKSIFLALEVDGYKYHKEGSEQRKRDEMKDRIFKHYNLKIVRFLTNDELNENVLTRVLKNVFSYNSINEKYILDDREKKEITELLENTIKEELKDEKTKAKEKELKILDAKNRVKKQKELKKNS